MKLPSVLFPLLCATLVTSNSVSFFGSGQQQQQRPLPAADDDKLSVPGENPLTYCADPTPYILTIDRVDLSPNPPTPGCNLSITASGTLAQDVDTGSTVFLQVKYGLITLLKQEADLCEQIGAVNLTCPLKEGPISFSRSVQIPKQIPKGTYSVMADVYTAAKEKITCMQSVVNF